MPKRRVNSSSGSEIGAAAQVAAERARAIASYDFRTQVEVEHPKMPWTLVIVRLDSYRPDLFKLAVRSKSGTGAEAHMHRAEWRRVGISQASLEGHIISFLETGRLR